MSRRTPLAAVAVAATAFACVAAGPAGAFSTTASPATTTASTTAGTGFVPGSRDDDNNAQLQRQEKQAKRAKAAALLGSSDAPLAAAASTVYYDASRAPRYAQHIAQSAQIWNGQRNVQMVSNPARATLRYYEGNDSRGSYAQTNGRGRGYIFIDYRQTQQYNALRVVSHETGHALGLPDRYSGPCSELMSGGGAGTSCTNPYPNAQERARVDTIWAYGVAPIEAKVVTPNQVKAAAEVS